MFWKLDNPIGKWCEFFRAFVDKEEEGEEVLKERQRQEQTVLEACVQNSEKDVRKVEGIVKAKQEPQEE